MVKNDKQLATKKDLEKLDIKFEAKLKAMETRLNQHIDNKLEDELKEWNTKIFDLVDGLAVDIKNNREHRAITSHQITENRARIEILEKKVFGTVNVAI